MSSPVNSYPELYQVLEKIHQQIREIVGQKKEHDAPALIMPFADITKEMTDWVGGKAANSGGSAKPGRPACAQRFCHYHQRL